MFLFTTPVAAPETRSQTPVLNAIRDGSDRTGADFGYLLSTAQRESSLDPEAKARTSSATGLYQFVEQTWLGILKGTGADHGLSRVADAITETKPGRFEVADARTKDQILALRNDPAIASVMAGELTRRNGASLAAALGRPASQGELYVAHLMGASAAVQMIRTAQADPRQSAAALFPEQAQANRGLFFDRASGKPRSIGEVHGVLMAGATGLAAPASGTRPVKADPADWFSTTAAPALATAYARADGPALHGLFRTEGMRGPVNQTVQQQWASLPRRSENEAARFFPRGAGQASAPTTEAPAAQAPAPVIERKVTIPLPPERPRGLNTPVASGLPLDLSALLKPRT